ncbi:MAG: NAD(P)/FAD-dependent oxidoreductase [Anaerolineales bacterium]|nr:NAD(P)/FAD-dependent oxidoreductase [Anaerolineales bacterium]
MSKPRVLIVGAGFGGLFAARTLANKPVDVLLVDRNNYHTFTPLLYQVATCALDPGGIAYPIRNIFSETDNVNCLLGDVIQIDDQNRTVTVQMAAHQRVEPYDYLILATGSIPAYFGNEVFRQFAWELRTLPDAVALRNHILYLFEQAAWTDDDAARQAMATIVVVGGGPTGLETAGAIYELYNHVLDREFKQRDLHTRVVLVELQPYLLTPYPAELREAALEQLRSLGVEVILETAVTGVTADSVTLSDGRVIQTHTLVWSAGVKASPLPGSLDLELKRGARVPIAPTTAVLGKERIYAVGDLAYLEDPQGQPYPMLIPVAQQQGILAAKNILAELNGRPPQAFSYNDRGIMATIGRKRAVAWIYNKYALKGFVAWLGWLGLHLVTLLGFRNRLVVMINWIWNYVTYDRTVRLILNIEETEPSPPAPTDT